MIPAISQAQNRPSNTGSDSSTSSTLLIGGLGVGIPGLIGIAIFLGIICRVMKDRINHPRTRATSTRRIQYRQTNNDDNYNDNDNDDAATATVATLAPQQRLAFSLPQLRQPVNTDSDSISETVNDRSLSNQPPPSYYEVQAQEKALPSYTEAIQENRLQESVETINAAGPSEVTVAKEQTQFQETAATS